MLTKFIAVKKPKYLTRTLLSACCALALQSNAHASSSGSNHIYVDKAGNAVIKVTDKSGVTLTVSSGDKHGDVIYTLESSNGTITKTLSGVTGNLTVQTSEGMDTLNFESLEVRKSLKILTGAGADSVEFFGLTVGKNLTIRTAKGDDVIDGGFASVGGHTFISTGANNDSVEIGAITTKKNLVVFTAAGNDFVDLETMTTHGITTIRTGIGADDIALTDIEPTNKLNVFTGRGNDNIEIADMNFSTPSRIFLGNGDDTLEITESVFNIAPLFHGGKGHDAYETENNNIFNKVEPKIVSFEKIIDVTEPEEPEEPTMTYEIGKTGPAGGIVFEINDAGTNGLEIMPMDIALGEGVAYGCAGTNVEGVNDGAIDPQSGADKTRELLAANCGADAAILASGFISPTGSDGWFLPSAVELKNALDQVNLPGNAYWTSSEQTDDSAFIVFTDISIPASPTDKMLTSEPGITYQVAPVRAF